MSDSGKIPRRLFVGYAAGALGLSLAAPLRGQQAPPDAAIGYEEIDFEAALRKVVGARRAVDHEALVLDMPALAGSGNSVEVAVRVEPGRIGSDTVRRIHVFAERNPRPHILTASFGADAPASGFKTRIRLSGTQFVSAYAETESGALWRARREITVTIGACDSLQFRLSSRT